jgi:predicted enzyme related to lactoylglutathione lyase
VDLQSDNPTKAIEFYSALFGWEVMVGPEEAGGYGMAMLNGRPAAGIGPKPMPEIPSVFTTYLASQDADATAAKVIEAGGQVFMPPFDVLDVGRMLVAADPSGSVFGVWQAKAHTGAQIYGEPGAYCWNEVQTRDYAAARAFYEKVFGFSYADVASGDDMAYCTFSVPGGEQPAGGMNDLTKMPGETPSHWLAWFTVANADDAVTRVGELGGSTIMPPFDSPYGRMAMVSGLEGEIFGVIDITTTVGAPPQG